MDVSDGFGHWESEGEQFEGGERSISALFEYVVTHGAALVKSTHTHKAVVGMSNLATELCLNSKPITTTDKQTTINFNTSRALP